MPMKKTKTPSSTSIGSESMIESKSMKRPISLKLIRNIALGLCTLLLVGGAGWYLGYQGITSPKDLLSKEALIPTKQTIDKSQPSNKNVDMKLFWQVWDKLEKNYLFEEKIDYQKMVYGAITGMTSALGDPYTAFFPPKVNKTSKENLNGAFDGIGIQLGYNKDSIVVIAPISGMPAEKAGVEAGDFILRIIDEANGVDRETYNMNLNEAVEIIRGVGGTPVKITFLHEGESEPYEVEIIREKIVVPSVEVKFGRVVNNEFLYDKAAATGSGKLVAHLRLTRFGELTDEQWDQSIDKILDKEDEVGGVVLDVRNNPGGYMQGAVNLAAEFLAQGKIIVKQESTVAPDQEFATQRYGRLLVIPTAILINKGSASASEILAGALSEHERAKLVGTTSFGKGTIQTAEDLDVHGAGLHITIARWLTPDGNWVHEKGLTPDFEVELDPERPTVDTQLVKAAEVVLE
jgi:carboxyl-terminal processing protease